MEGSKAQKQKNEWQVWVWHGGWWGGGWNLGTHFIEPPRVDSWVKTSADPATYLVTLWYCRPKVTSEPPMQAYVEIKTPLPLWCKGFVLSPPPTVLGLIADEKPEVRRGWSLISLFITQLSSSSCWLTLQDLKCGEGEEIGEQGSSYLAQTIVVIFTGILQTWQVCKDLLFLMGETFVVSLEICFFPSPSTMAGQLLLWLGHMCLSRPGGHLVLPLPWSISVCLQLLSAELYFPSKQHSQVRSEMTDTGSFVHSSL